MTVKLNGTVAIRLYSDNRPHNLEISAIQKGLILMVCGEELIEEGAGFGVPVAKYSDHTFFSSTAHVWTQQRGKNNVILKTYFLDTISEKQIGGVSFNRNLYSFFRKSFERAYLKSEGLRPVFDWLMHLRKALGIQTQFTKAPSRGSITVAYHCMPQFIRVHVDLSALDNTKCQEILILNEQGASAFKHYSDSDNISRVGREIGAWRTVNAREARFFSSKRHVGFSLKNIPGASLHCGWEQVNDRFSWAGLSYSLDVKTKDFSYDISFRQARMAFPKFSS